MIGLAVAIWMVGVSLIYCIVAYNILCLVLGVDRESGEDR